MHWISSFHCWFISVFIWNVSIFNAIYFQRWPFSSNPSIFLRVYLVPSFNLFAHECINIIDRHNFISWTLKIFACIFVLCTSFFRSSSWSNGRIFLSSFFLFLIWKMSDDYLCLYLYLACIARGTSTAFKGIKFDTSMKTTEEELFFFNLQIQQSIAYRNCV